MTESPRRLLRWLRIKWKVSAFALTRHWFLIVFALAIMAISFAIWPDGPPWWNEALLGIVTLAVAILIWFGEAEQDWTESLPKKLDVIFRFEGRVVMHCRRATLPGESDIRTWGVAIGAQMNGGKPNLVYEPYMHISPPVTMHERGTEPYRLYIIEFTLTALPQRVDDLDQREPEAHHCILWVEEQGRRKETIETVT